MITNLLFSIMVCINRNIGGEITYDGDYLMFEGNRYRNGFLYKNFVMSAIVSWYYIYISYGACRVCVRVCARVVCVFVCVLVYVPYGANV